MDRIHFLVFRKNQSVKQVGLNKPFKAWRPKDGCIMVLPNEVDSYEIQKNSTRKKEEIGY